MKDKIRCEKCGSTQTWIRFRTNERVCQTCGYIKKLKPTKN